MKAVLLVCLQASLLHLTPLKLNANADNIYTTWICTKAGLWLCVCVMFIFSVVSNVSVFCLSTGTHGPIRLEEIESLQHRDNIITVNLTLRFSIINSPSWMQNKLYGNIDSTSVKTQHVDSKPGPLTELTATSSSCKNRTRIVYALLGPVIGQPVVCILVH